MPRRIPIRALRKLAKEQGLRQVILLAWDGARTQVVTYGETVEDCDQAAQGGERMKAAMGWPETLNALPSRVKSLQAKVNRLEAAISWALGENAYAHVGDFGEDDAAESERLKAGGRMRPYWWRAKLSQLSRGAP
jgi:hypothetical protein